MKNLLYVQSILSKSYVAPEDINPLIKGLEVEYLDKLTNSEKVTLEELLSKMLTLVNVPGSGAYLDDVEKAESLLAYLRQ